MNGKVPRAVFLGAICVLAAGCAHTKSVKRGTVILIDNDQNWERREEGSFAVYKINMSGAPPFTRVVVSDEPAKEAFLSLYPPQALSNQGHVADVDVQTLPEYEKGLMGPDKEAEAVRVLTELKTHAAVVFDYLNLR